MAVKPRELMNLQDESSDAIRFSVELNPSPPRRRIDIRRLTFRQRPLYLLQKYRYPARYGFIRHWLSSLKIFSRTVVSF